MWGKNDKFMIRERNMKVSWYNIRKLRKQVLFYLLIALPPNKAGSITINVSKHDIKMHSWV